METHLWDTKAVLLTASQKKTEEQVTISKLSPPNPLFSGSSPSIISA